MLDADSASGNCPKYINKQRIHPAMPEPKLVSDSPVLQSPALDLISKADMFFISSSHGSSDMDTNHRGGPIGFIRTYQDENTGKSILVYPEYSGNRLYQTLGNLRTTPLAGLVIPDFATGDVLYLTGSTEILIGPKASAILPHSNLAVKITIDAARHVEKGLSFRGESEELSPYNPVVRYLASEKPSTAAVGSIEGTGRMTATLLKKTIITPTISRYRFRCSDRKALKQVRPGQYVALSFKDELDMGYSHMRDDDPRSLNDDLLRTFTISSPPSSHATSDTADDPADDEFEITIREVGIATTFLAKKSLKSSLKLPLQGFAGDFSIEAPQVGSIGVIAGGIGITPLIPALPSLAAADAKLRLLWSLAIADLPLAIDLFERYPYLATKAIIFTTKATTTGSVFKNAAKDIEHILSLGSVVNRRRLGKDDLFADGNAGSISWYICASPGLRKSALEWLDGQNAQWEDFGY
jgi:NAD(P)H-flavin reductase